jgi:hypothetical protein
MCRLQSVIITGITLIFQISDAPKLPCHFHCMNRVECHPAPREDDAGPSKEREEKVGRLKDKSGTLRLLVTAQLEVLASLESELCLGLDVVKDLLTPSIEKNRTLQAVHSNRSTTFLVVFALYTSSEPAVSVVVDKAHLVEDRLGLTTITTLLAVIATLSLGEQRSLARLVLCNLVLGIYDISACVH